MDVADLPGASMLDVPGTGGVEPKDGSRAMQKPWDFSRLGRVVGTFVQILGCRKLFWAAMKWS